MRKICAALVAGSLLTATAMAAPALAPGKPAGLKHAQDKDDNTVLYILGIGAVAAGIALIASGSDHDNNMVTTPPATTTTTTAKSATTST
jgi:hypothetical protein